MSVGGVEDQAVDARLEERRGLGGDVAVDPDGGGDPQRAVVVEGRAVERGPERADPGEHAHQPSRPVDGDRERRVRGRVEVLERDPRVGVGTDA